jgi:hypothetical protein
MKYVERYVIMSIESVEMYTNNVTVLLTGEGFGVRPN